LHLTKESLQSGGGGRQYLPEEFSP